MAQAFIHADHPGAPPPAARALAPFELGAFAATEPLHGPNVLVFYLTPAIQATEAMRRDKPEAALRACGLSGSHYH